MADNNKNNVEYVAGIAAKVMEAMAHAIKGKDDVIKSVLIAFLSEGHVLLEDVPGVGKTKLAQALARSIDTEFKRIQFTPDLLPNDITGINMYNEATRDFSFLKGPVFANVVLADEINRGTPRVQSSLLECMSEAIVTVDGKPYQLQRPFFVIATQNPADFHGTYPLPEAQLDRFAMRLTMGFPDEKTEMAILASNISSAPIDDIKPVAEGKDLLECQRIVRQVHVSEAVQQYISTLMRETRNHPALAYGCSTRAAIAIMHAAQALAAIEGRDFVVPRDVKELVPCMLPHRIPLKLQARTEWTSTSQVIASILDKIPIE